EPDAERMTAVRVLGLELEPRQPRAEAHDLALVRGPARARGAGEVQRLEQVRLAGAIATRDHRQPRSGAELSRLVRAEIPQAEVSDDHTLSRLGISRTSADSSASRPSRRNSGLKPISNGSPWNGTGTVSCASPTSGVRADTVS